MRRRLVGLIVAAAALLGAASPAAAAVTRFEIKRTVPAFGGQSFGASGAYQLVEGTAYFEVDPRLPVNALIANIQRAPKNARGMVEMDADIAILRPADPAKGNHHLFYEPVNRGNMVSLSMFNGAGGGGGPLTEARAAGDGFLMKRGYTIVFAGWQPTYPIADAPPMSIGGGSRLPVGGGRLLARLPIARNADGTAITQRIGAGIGAGPNTGPAGPQIAYLTYPAADTADKSAYVRDSSTGKAVPGATWRYIDEWRVEVTRPAAARDQIEFFYTAKDPVVYGLALASMRDLVSFLRYDPKARDVAPGITKAIGFGASQTGRTIKNLIYHFNDDERGRQVFDGAHIHISGASLNSQNVVFGQPGQKGGEAFPYTYETLFDPYSRRMDGWLMRCSGTKTCPKIIHTDSDAELSLAGSLVYTDMASKDVKIPDNVRVYLLSSSQHGPAAAPAATACENFSNPMPYRQPMHALNVALDDWITTGKAPPPSRHPRRDDGTLVTPQEAKAIFPKIPRFTFSEDFPPMYVTDPASGEAIADLPYPLFRPKTDADGNTVAGIRNAELAVPLATYTGWNPRAGGGSCPATGSYMAFAKTKAERLASGDPRLSIEERYPTEAAYVTAIRKATADLVRQRYMLAEDAAEIVAGSPDRYRKAMGRP